MATRKHGKKRKAVEGEDPIGSGLDPKRLIAQARKRVQAKLGQSSQRASEDIDLDHLIRTVHALLATNKEIWERLKPHAVYENESKKTFKRVLFPTIKVQTTESNGTHNCLTFTTEATSESKRFNSPKSPPENLMPLLAVPETAKTGLEIIEQLFLGSFVLHEDVLIPFLLSLKQHLEAVQVDFEKIEEWLMQPADIVSFIEKHFDKKLKLPSGVDSTGDDPAGSSSSSDSDESSDSDSSDSDDPVHQPTRVRVRVQARGTVSDSSDSSDDSSERSSDSDSSDSDDPVHQPGPIQARVQARGADSDSSSDIDESSSSDSSDSEASDQVKGLRTLKECKVSCRHFQTFDIRKVEEQERLVKFLGCLSCL